MPITVVPESNYITDLRGSIKIYSPHDFVACISETWNGCTPALKNKPSAELVPGTVANEYYLAFGSTSDFYMSMKVYSLKGLAVFKVEGAWLLIGIWTDPDEKKHLLFKIGDPVDVPAIEKVWVIKKNGDILYGEVPRNETYMEKIGTVEDTFFTIYSDGNVPPVIMKPKLAIPTAVWVVLTILGLAGIGGITYWAIETHKANKEAEVRQYAIDKQAEWLNTITDMVKQNPELADIFAGITEIMHAVNSITFQMPNNINPHKTTAEDTSPWDKFVSWIQQNWQSILLPLIGIIVLIFKWEVILDFIRGIIERFRRRR